MSNEITTRLTLSEARALADVAVKSKLLPISNVDAACLLILMGGELGLSPFQALRGIHIIDGKPTLSAALMVAVVKARADLCEFFVQVVCTPTEAIYRTKRRGDPQPTERTWTMDDAKRAGLAGRGNWSKYPAAMLAARCSSALARDVYPDLLLGVYDPDEIAKDESTSHPALDPVVEVLPRLIAASERLLDPASTHAAEYPALLPDADQAVIDDLRAKIDAAPTRAALALLMSGVDKSSAIYRVVKHEANAKHASLPAPLGSTPKSANATSSRVTANEPTPDSPQWQRAPLALSVQDDAPRQPGEDA